MAACAACNNGINKDVWSVIFSSLFCAIFLRAGLALAGAAVKGSMTFRVELDNPSHFSLGTQNRLLRS